MNKLQYNKKTIEKERYMASNAQDEGVENSLLKDQ